MGIGVVIEVRDHWHHLSAPARLVAYAIASRVLDKPGLTKNGEVIPARCYWGGNDQLSWDLWKVGPASPDYASKRRMLSKHMAELRRTGFLIVERDAYRGSRALYRVGSPKVELSVPPFEELSVPPRGGTESSSMGELCVPPQEERRTREDWKGSDPTKPTAQMSRSRAVRRGHVGGDA